MDHPEPRALEAFVAGQLSATEHGELSRHLGQCSQCRGEVAFLTAVRIGLGQGGQLEAAGPECLSDEALAAVLDGALDPGQQARALGHLAGCGHCAAGLVALGRALAEVDPEAHSPTPALLNRAIRIGAPGRSASGDARQEPRPTPGRGWFERLFATSLPRRLALAGAAAALVLALSLILADRGPLGPEPLSAPPPGSGPQVAEQSGQMPGPAAPPAGQPSVGAPSAAPAQPGPVKVARPGAQTQAAPAGPERPAPEARDWLAGLEPDTLARLGSQVRPGIGLPAPRPGQALSASQRRGTFSDGYVLGRALGFLQRFGSRVGESAALRREVAETLGSLGPAIRAWLPAGEATDRLVHFADDLAAKLSSGQVEPGTASRRLAVFSQALREALEAQEPLRGGLKLGLLVQGWQTEARADALGLDLPVGDLAALERARKVIRSDPGLGDPMRRSVLQDLNEIEKLSRSKADPQRATRILDELDRRLRTGR